MTGVELLVALAIAVGLVGILVPVLPGSVLILGGVPLTATAAGWLVAWREPPAIARPVIE